MTNAPDCPDAIPSALAVGMAAPDFPFSPTPEKPNSLSDLRGQPVVLAFFPAGWDPARAEQIAQYNAILSHLPSLNAELLDLSVDGPYRRLAFAGEQVQVPFVTEAVPGGAVAQRYGVAGRTALFVVDAEGIIRWRYIAPVGATPNADDLLAALRALSVPSGIGGGGGLSRREFIAATLAAAFALAAPLTPTRADDAGPSPAGGSVPPVAAAGTMPITLKVNGTVRTLDIEPRVTLLDVLRERMGLTGSKKGCDHGQCGACTVHVDGRRVNSCLTLAVSCQGKEITTVEGLARGDALHPMQTAFIAHDGFQCGYCTPGQIMSAVALLREPVGPEDADVRESMSGNICRCGAYPNIVAAVQSVRKGNSDASV
ncbi:MAG: redoxin domain-containing protein [Armatimonadetes bacterium]|nr:redoxin domain-containing protein [Armatimonadota bacterium]